MLTTFVTIGLLGLAAGHSWIEEYQVIGPDGNYIGDRGFSRGYVGRTDPQFNGEAVKYQLPALDSGRNRINSDDLLCHPSQRTSNYANPNYPKLKVRPGDFVAMKYLENGHVTLPWGQLGKPKASGTVFVYGTTKPSQQEKIADVLQWTRDGHGGNGKGFLMSAQNYDDGRCHQLNCGNISLTRQVLFPDHAPGQATTSLEQWCESDVQIPTSQPAGTLTTYWVWQWPTEPNADCTFPDGKDEYYTTCADFDVVNALPKVASPHTLAQEDPQTKAVSNFRGRTAYTASPVIDPPTSTGGFCVSSSSAAPLTTCAPVSVFTGEAYTSALKMNQMLVPLTENVNGVAAQTTPLATTKATSTGSSDGEVTVTIQRTSTTTVPYHSKVSPISTVASGFIGAAKLPALADQDVTVTLTRTSYTTVTPAPTRVHARAFR